MNSKVFAYLVNLDADISTEACTCDKMLGYKSFTSKVYNCFISSR